MRKKIMRIKTDSRAPEEPKEPEGDPLLSLYSLFASEADKQATAEKCRRGGFGYGEIKQAIAEAVEAYFGDARRRRDELLADPGYVEDVLRAGAEKAREKAREVLDRAQAACGVSR